MMQPADKALSELATIIRSKNAGPYLITFDVLFKDRQTYQLVCESEALTASTVAAAFHIPRSRVSSFFHVPMANAIKVTIRRSTVQGAVGDSDVYGCQQHVPLMQMRIPMRKKA